MPYPWWCLIDHWRFYYLSLFMLKKVRSLQVFKCLCKMGRVHRKTFCLFLPQPGCKVLGGEDLIPREQDLKTQELKHWHPLTQPGACFKKQNVTIFHPLVNFPNYFYSRNSQVKFPLLFNSKVEYKAYESVPFHFHQMLRNFKELPISHSISQENNASDEYKTCFRIVKGIRWHGSSWASYFTLLGPLHSWFSKVLRGSCIMGYTPFVPSTGSS